MKFYISCDMEGVTGVVSWDEVEKNHPDYQAFRDQMTREVGTVCQTLTERGVSEILVKDAHDSARNLMIDQLPANVKIHRAFAVNPLCMMMGIDESYDGVIFTGYHSASGTNTNPLAHTMSVSKINTIKINGEIASEFLINAYAAAYYKVPVFAITGDQGICMEAKMKIPSIVTIPVKHCEGAACTTIHPEKALELIKENIEGKIEDFRHHPQDYLIEMPELFHIEIDFTRHVDAYRASFYPGVKQIGAQRVVYETKDYYEFLRMFYFTL